MGIRYEKDTILNWINEIGKFLRLLVDKREGMHAVETATVDVEAGYMDFFGKDRAFFQELSDDDLLTFVEDLDPKKIRPLALLLMHDGFLNKQALLLSKAKFLLENQMRITGEFSFEDYAYLADIDKQLKLLES